MMVAKGLVLNEFGDERVCLEVELQIVGEKKEKPLGSLLYLHT